MSQAARKEPITHGELLENLEAQKRMLWETEGRIFALACEAKERRERGEPEAAVGTTLRYLRATIGAWETIRNGIKQQELLLGVHRRELP